MISHVVIFWTDPANPKSADALIAGARQHLPKIPGITHFHIGKMTTSDREVVAKDYQVGLNLGFTSKQALSDYQVHPSHVEFVERAAKPNCTKHRVYDFE